MKQFPKDMDCTDADDLDEIRVYPARKGMLGLVVALGLMAIALGLILLPEGRRTISLIVMMVIGISWVIMFISALLRGAPKITLSCEGLKSDGYFRTRFWTWNAIGPFSALAQDNRLFITANLQDQKSASSNYNTWPSGPDIRIDVSLLFATYDISAAQRLVDEINARRGRFA